MSISGLWGGGGDDGESTLISLSIFEIPSWEAVVKIDSDEELGSPFIALDSVSNI